MFLVFVEVHFGVCSHLFKHQSYHFLLLGRKQNVATPTLEILVASEVEDEVRYELVILLWVHMLLEVGESSGENHRLFIPIVCTCLVLATSGGIDQTQILFVLLHEDGVGYLVQTGSRHGAAAMLTHRIVGW